MKNFIFIIYYYIKTFFKFSFLLISKEKFEFIIKIIKYIININKLIYLFLIFIFINKEYISNYSKFYIFNEYNFFLEKRKLNKMMKKEIKKHNLKLKIKNFIIFIYILNIYKIENNI